MYQEFSCIQIKVHVARNHVNENFGSDFFSLLKLSINQRKYNFFTLW